MIKRFISYLTKTLRLSNATVKAYNNHLTQLQDYLISNGHSLLDATSQQIQEYLDTMTTVGKSAATCKQAASTYRSFYKWLKHEGIITDDNIRYVQTPRLSKNLPRISNDIDFLATIKDISIDGEIRAMIVLMRICGMRISEVLALRTADIDKTTNTILINGKGNKQRKVYYSDGAKDFLNSHCRPKDGYIFPFSDRQARYNIYLALSKHTNSNATNSHSLRHAFATRLVEAGAQLTTVQSLLGHSDIKTTSRYLHCAEKAIKADYFQNSIQLA